MGISNPDVGYNGISPSDDVLALEPVERTAIGSNWFLLYRGLWLTDITYGSIIRLKTDIHVDAAQVGSIEWKINGLGIWNTYTTSNAYVTKTDDIEVSWKRNSTFEIYARVQGGDKIYLKNISICGIQSPGVLWVA